MATAKNTPSPVYLGPRQAARYLGVDLSELKAMRDLDGMPFHRGGVAYKFIYEAHSLDAWFAAHECTTRPLSMPRYG
jgi:hypothetical protein